MLNIYRSRESIDKEKYIYDHIQNSLDEDPSKRVLVIVPDQYTLAGEKQAMDRLGTEVLLDIEITGISRLGYRLLEETGSPTNTIINHYGRHMLIARILKELNEEFLAFKGFGNKETFIDAINDFISAAKQHQIIPEDLAALAKGSQHDCSKALLSRKLRDLSLIYSKYQERLAGKYSDNEDMLELYIRAIPKSKNIRNSIIWIYNFDSFTPKNMAFITELAKYAQDVNIHLTHDENCFDEDLFVLSQRITDAFMDKAEEAGIRVGVFNISSEEKKYQAIRKAGISHVEKNLFSVSPVKVQDSSGIYITECSNIYTEIEAAALHVLYLLREKNMRLTDIVLICNDQEYRGPIINRVFKEYGLNIFDDRKRQVISSPIAVFALSMLQTVAYGYRTTDVMRVLKSGLTGIPEEDIEELENYALKYNIKGSMWKDSFTRGTHEAMYQEGLLEEIEETRQVITGLVERLEIIYEEAATYGDFANAFRELLLEQGALSEDLAEAQRAEGMEDLAQETEQVVEAIGNILLQLAEIMDDQPFDGQDFVSLFRSGLSQAQVGVLPPTNDDIMLGTMQRTRSGDVKALLVIAANDDLIPRVAGEDVLFSKEELDILSQAGQNLGLESDIRLMEENLAIYRNLTKPSEELWISYATLDQDASELRPSVIVGYIDNLFENLEIQPDPLAADRVETHIGGHMNTLRHYTEAMTRGKQGQALVPGWSLVRSWLGEKDLPLLNRVDKALDFENIQDPLERGTAEGLYAAYIGDDGNPLYRFSPTGLENYSKCPFAFFVDRGLKAQELRLDQVGGREIGELYHSVLQQFTEEVGRNNGWDQVSREESDSRIREIALEWAKEYRSDLFDKGQAESYRLVRAIEACQNVAWAVVVQAKEGSIKESLFEVPFGINGGNANGKGQIILDPIVKELSKGKAYIQGKIDRVDILDNNRVKIIDYKTGNEVFDIEEVKAGYRLQLMLYLEAAQENKREPAGVFYFLIKEPEIKMEDGEILTSQEIEDKTLDSYRMDGLLVEDEQIISQVAGDFEEGSSVLKIKRKKDGDFDKHSKKRMLPEEEFKELQQVVDQVTRDICQNIADGKIDLTPKVTKKVSTCTYCNYHGICRFDPLFKGCKYDVIKRQKRG